MMGRMFGRRRRRDPAPADQPPQDGPSSGSTAEEPPAGPGPADALLAAIVAHHLDGAVVDEGTARVVSPALTVECHVDQLSAFGPHQTAACFFDVSGGRLGATPVFASVSGYGATPQEAVADGGHAWVGLVSSLLRAADDAEREGDVPPAGDGDSAGDAEPEGDVERFEVVLDGRRFLLVVDGIDRGFTGGERDDVPSGLRELRRRIGGSPWLLPRLVEDGRLPLLGGADAALVSLLVAEWPTLRTVELKVNGADWTTAGVLEEAVERPDGLVGAMLRELALLVPLDPPGMPERAAVQRTLDGLAQRQEPRQAAGWQGWAAHGGVLGPVLDDVQLAEVEAGTGPLPDDVRRFLTQVAGPGAGPGYGLLPLRRLGDVVPLAHAGCGNAWVLLLQGPSRGTVWIDAPGSDETTTQVASSFTEWFTGWLDAAVRDRGPWLQYDVRACATVSVLSQMLTAASESASAAGEPEPTSLAGHMRDGGLRLSGGGAYLPEGPLDPCHGCVTVASSLSLPPSVFAPGPLTSASL